MNRDQTLVRTMRRVEADVDRGGWDQQRYRLFGVLPTYDVLEVPDFTQLAGPGGTHLDALRRLTKLGRRLQYGVPKALRPFGELQAWLMIHEAWGLFAHRTSASPAEQVATALQREVYKHPDRVELRFVFGVDREQEDYWLIRERGGELVTMQEFMPPDYGDGDLGGAVHKHLHKLMHTTLTAAR